MAKEKQQTQAPNFEANAEDFIPYACHFDDHTVLTKNGELMQVIKITGFSFESVHADDDSNLTVRDAIRQAITDNISMNGFALWFHTIRRKYDLTQLGEQEDFYPNALNNSWNEENNWKNKYINEVYVTIIHEGQALNFTDPKAFVRSIYFPAEFRFRQRFLQDASEHLHIIVKNILDTLSNYGARRLKVVKKPDGIYYSQILRFLGKIINLHETDIPLTPVDTSQILPSHKTIFGHNTIKVMGHSGQHFGGILTIKEYQNVALHAVDLFLQQEHEYIITETFDYVNQKSALEKFNTQKDLYRLSEDKRLYEISGLKEIVESDTGGKTDFGEHQIVIMLLADTAEELEIAITDAVIAFNDLGIVVIREDVFLEDCYWSQLPANFDFCKRMSSIATRHIAGYASLYNYPAGRIGDNHWGDAVTVFFTSFYTPYFFNFHYENNGHTFIIGPFNSGKTVLLNFLVSEATKFKPRVFYFDRHHNSEVFISALGGEYTNITRINEGAKIQFNPLQIEETERNLIFLTKWFSYIFSPDHTKLSQKQKKKVTQAVEYSFSLPPEERTLSKIIPKFWSQKDDGDELGTVDDEKMSASESSSQNLGSLLMQDDAPDEAEEDLLFNRSTETFDDVRTAWEKISACYGDGESAHIFDNPKDTFDPHSNNYFGFDLTQMVDDKYLLTAVVHYLTHRINTTLDGSPSIIVLDEAWDLLDNPAFNDRIAEWLDELTAKNSIAIFATESVNGAEKSPMTHILAEKIKTKIFLPNNDANAQGYEEVFGLSHKEFEMLTSMDSYHREFLLIHDIDAVVARLNLKNLPFHLSVLSASVDELNIFNSTIEYYGSDPEKWLPEYEKKLLT